jgi:hypothetical protein
MADEDEDALLATLLAADEWGDTQLELLSGDEAYLGMADDDSLANMHLELEDASQAMLQNADEPSGPNDAHPLSADVVDGSDSANAEVVRSASVSPGGSDGEVSGDDRNSGTAESPVTPPATNASEVSVEPGNSELQQTEKRGFYISRDLRVSATSKDGAVGTIESVYGDQLRSLNDEILWSLSSARPGNGILEVLNEDVRRVVHDKSQHYLIHFTPPLQTSTFWQSDGVAPHHVVMSFYKRQSIAEIAVYVDFGSDESYTPSDMIIRAGHLVTDSEDVVRVQMKEPSGWVRIPLINPAKTGLQRYLRAHILTLTIVGNHQAGRDCHLRCIQVLGPQDTGKRFALPSFTSASLCMFSEIR